MGKGERTYSDVEELHDGAWGMDGSCGRVSLNISREGEEWRSTQRATPSMKSSKMERISSGIARADAQGCGGRSVGR